MQRWRTIFQKLFILLIFLSIILIGLLATVPPVSRDALTHHLAVPKLYLQHGGIYEIPSVVFSYYPMNLDLLYLLPLYFGNDILPNYIHFGFALLTAWLIFNYIKKRMGALHALIGALFFLTTPIIIKLSTTAYVDLGLIFFSTAAILYMLRWAESDFNVKFLLYSAIFCGLALGTKYNGLIVLFFLTLFVPIVYIRSKAGNISNISQQMQAVGFGCFFCLVALIIFSPWMIRNYIWTHNPVYPLYDHWFNPKPNQLNIIPSTSKNDDDSQSLSDESQSWSHFRVRRIIYQESWIETLTIPIRIFFEGRDDDPKFFDGRLNPFLIIFPFFAFWPSPPSSSNNHKMEKRFLAIFAILYLLFVYVQIDMRIRWISPIIPPLVILSVTGIYNLTIIIAQKKNAVTFIQYSILSLVIILAIGINLNYLRLQFETVRPWEYISGKISRPDYIRKHRPEYSVIDYANQNLPKDSTILALFLGNRIYYSNHHMNCNFNMFFQYLKVADSENFLYKKLREEAFSVIIIRFDLFQQWAEKVLSDKEKKILSLFWDMHLKPIYVKDGFGLFALIDCPKENSLQTD